MESDVKSQIIKKLVHVQSQDELEDVKKLLKLFKKNETFFGQENKWQFHAASTYLKKQIADMEAHIAKIEKLTNDDQGNNNELMKKTSSLDPKFVYAVLKIIKE